MARGSSTTDSSYRPRHEVPSRGVEIGRRRCNLSLVVTKPGPGPTKGANRHEQADHNPAGTVKSDLGIDGGTHSPRSPEVGATAPGRRSHQPARSAEVPTASPGRCRTGLSQWLRPTAATHAQQRHDY